MINNFQNLIEVAQNQNKMKLAVAAAQEHEVLTSVCNAYNLGIVDPILTGNRVQINKIADEYKLDISNFRIIDTDTLEKAAYEAVKLVSIGEADFVMKGILDTSTLLKAVLNKECGLRSGNLLSHVMVYKVENYNKFLVLTDGGMNIEPTLYEKVDILKNSIEVVRKLGYKTIKVACLAAKEKVSSKMKSTVDAASIKQLSIEGEFGEDVIVEGPIALDLAISKEAAEIKNFESEVSGDADIILVPAIEVGNGIGKAMTLFANAQQGGLIMGAKAPVVMVSRSDTHEAKLNSIALGSVVANKNNR
ncbi:bifunctional enoyl-CoA hydratase/phosphate acetyltransferase [Romboutsia weinsteinii]|uniref:Bifunctional enoyl-CoA hydratase/phosphate acetyltransferase n=1 Tax=Romboutsia weinsteinii TaxID=2020949 RepID=A0A371IZ04_9FIRM|nr:bifunctional enoyl-CoA hydratase/phosphate acetyltransferase [Romboutsia weinsteinii]RDY25713.1 bifunctional enoyl-CoA hydratase/phosphate acetyltransferase [Romboutsia weinsteinii]